jgi:hypothetical protein
MRNCNSNCRRDNNNLNNNNNNAVALAMFVVMRQMVFTDEIIKNYLKQHLQKQLQHHNNNYKNHNLCTYFKIRYSNSNCRCDNNSSNGSCYNNVCCDAIKVLTDEITKNRLKQQH